MIVAEALLLTGMLTVLVIAGYTDCRSGLIANNLIVMGMVYSIPLDIIYYVFFAREYILLFLINLLIIFLIAFFFYIYNLWAAGDSKLFFLIGLALPGRFYTFWHIGTIPSFIILILIFSLAFLYIIAETIFIGVKEKDLFRFTVGEIDYKRASLSYLSGVSLIVVVNWLIWHSFFKQLQEDLVLSIAVNFFVVLSLIQIRERLNNQKLFALTAGSWIIVLCLVCTGQYQFQMHSDLCSWAMVFIIMFIRMIAEKYNYQVIPTEKVKCGQILAITTILGFQNSRVKGLPKETTEDLRSRITESEAESIKRWKESKYGKPFIVIVRKIPFAIFIGIGTVTFIVLGVVML